MDIADILRRIENLIRLGTVAEVDLSSTPAKCRVKSGNITTDFLPFVTDRAGTTSTWDPLTVGEQVMIFSPSGETGAGIVMSAIHQASIPAPSNSADEYVRTFPDGATIKYNHAAGHLDVIGIKTATIQAETSVLVDTPDATFTGNVQINGNATVDQKLTYKGGMQGSTGSGASASISGNVDFSGGSLTHNGKNIGWKHNHAGVQPGSGNSGDVV
ncbi:MAG: phage baseplate assembly protein V [Fluviibacter sp.]